MDWANERWVRLYTRDTTTWKMLDWRARTVLMHMLRKVDRAGVLEVGDTGTMGLAAVLELPLEIVEPGVERLLHPRLRVVVETPTAYVLPNYLEAQEAVQTTNHRSAEYRARKRDYALAAAKPAIAELVRLPAAAPAGGNATSRDGAVTKRDAGVTRGHATSPVLDLETSERGDLPTETDSAIDPIVTKRDADITPRDETITRHHAASQLVTPIRSDPNDLSPAHAIAPSTPYRATGVLTPEEVAQHRELGRLAESMWARVSASRVAIAAELGLTGIIALPILSPVHEPSSFRELRARIREEGPAARDVCDHVHDVLCAQARAKRDVEWLGEKGFLPGSWREARNGSPNAPLRERVGPKGSAARAPEEPPRRKVTTIKT